MWGRGEKDETDESKRRKGSGTLNKAEALQEGRRQLKMLEKKDCAFYLLATDASKKGKKNKPKPTHRRWSEDSLGRGKGGFAKSLPSGLSSLPSYGHHTSVLIPSQDVFAPCGQGKRFGCFQPHSQHLLFSPRSLTWGSRATLAVQGQQTSWWLKGGPQNYTSDDAQLRASTLRSSAAQYFRLHLLPCKCIHLQTGQYLQTPKHLAPGCFNPLGNGWRTPHSGLLKTFGGGKKTLCLQENPPCPSLYQLQKRH